MVHRLKYNNNAWMRGGWRYLSSHTLIGDQHLSVLTQTQEWMVWWDVWDYSKAWIFSKRWSPIGLWVQDLSMSVTTLLYEWDRALWSRLVNVSHNTALGCVCVCVWTIVLAADPLLCAPMCSCNWSRMLAWSIIFGSVNRRLNRHWRRSNMSLRTTLFEKV